MYCRNAWTATVLTIVFVASQAPFQVYELMKLFHQSSIGFKVNPTWGTPYANWTFETDIILNCLVYVACALHPIIYFALNPEYRTGLVNVWRTMACNQTPAQVCRFIPSEERFFFGSLGISMTDQISSLQCVCETRFRGTPCRI